MLENIQIRKFSTQDKSKLINLLKLNIPEYFDESEVLDFKNYMGNHIELYFVAELENEIVGAGGINFENNYTVAKISWDFIHPKFQKIGLGKKMLAHRINILKGMKNLQKITVRTSQLAYLFYEKNGFQLKKIEKDYWAKGFDLYEMVYKE